MMQYSVSVVHSSSSGEIDETTVVSWVTDGDTFNTTSGERIRLADINAPEQGESGYYEARDLLISLVYNKQLASCLAWHGIVYKKAVLEEELLASEDGFGFWGLNFTPKLVSYSSSKKS